MSEPGTPKIERKEKAPEPEREDPIELVLAEIKPGQTVLDLGAFDGAKSQSFHEKGAKVTAVERGHVEKPPEGVEWHETTIEKYLEQAAGRTFDYVVLNNVLQYFDHDAALAELLPKLKALVKDGGRFALETFTKHPEPPFDKPHKSTFTAEELAAVFADWPGARVWERSPTKEDLRKEEVRLWFIVDVLAQKPIPAT